ncbi:MAG: hypothetical protein KIT09_32845 [Bryobacteraceae bacterium]|nr:hypothetical protein [Bryobacteraceae bacterium]
MGRVTLLTLTLIGGSAFLAAQNPLIHPDSNQITIRGCLELDSPGNYILREPSGNMVVLAGLESKVYEHVNQEVTLTGWYSDEAAADEPQAERLFRYRWVQPAGGACGRSNEQPPTTDNQ